MKALTFKEKQEVLTQMFNQYQRAKLQLECLERKNFYPSIDYMTVKEKKTFYQGVDKKYDSYIQSKDELKQFITTFDMILDQLSKDSYMIIYHDFVIKKEKNWWLEYYSRSTYYRLKTRAMEEVLFYFNCL